MVIVVIILIAVEVIIIIIINIMKAPGAQAQGLPGDVEAQALARFN